MRQIRRRVADGSILNLIKLFLESGVMVGNKLIETEEGSPQGGGISLLLANIYLGYFDQWTMKRGYRIVRYADDILIFASSRKGTRLLPVYMSGNVQRRHQLWKGIFFYSQTEGEE